MQKVLEFVREEEERSYDDTGTLTTSLEKKFYKYMCHEPNAECQLAPVVCRIVDRFHPENEPQWEVNEAGCAQCYSINSRLLEDLYSKTA